MTRRAPFIMIIALLSVAVFAYGAFTLGYQLGELTRTHWLAP